MRYLALIILLSATLRSQTGLTGSISGQIVDESLAFIPLPDVRITPIDESFASIDRAGDEAGAFRFTGIPAGDYLLTAKVGGFRETVRPVRVVAGKETNLGMLSLPFGLCNEPGGMICDAFGAKPKRVPEKIPILTVCEALLDRDVYFSRRVVLVGRSGGGTLTANCSFALSVGATRSGRSSHVAAAQLISRLLSSPPVGALSKPLTRLERL